MPTDAKARLEFPLYCGLSDDVFSLQTLSYAKESSYGTIERLGRPLVASPDQSRRVTYPFRQTIRISVCLLWQRIRIHFSFRVVKRGENTHHLLVVYGKLFLQLQ